MDFLYAGKQLEVANIKINPRADGAQHSHARARRPVHLEPQLHQVLDDLLYQRLVGAFLHGNNHKNPLAMSGEQRAVSVLGDSSLTA
jgi:hypothetical protein